MKKKKDVDYTKINLYIDSSLIDKIHKLKELSGKNIIDIITDILNSKDVEHLITHKQSDSKKPFYTRIKKKDKRKLEKLEKQTGETLSVIFNEKVHDYFKNKLLNCDYLNPKKYYYFSKKELLKYKRIKATEIKNIVNMADDKDTVIVTAIPNNFDEFNNEYNSYCYENNLYLHKGIIIDSEIYDEFKIFIITTKIGEKSAEINLLNYPDDMHLIDEFRLKSNKKGIKKDLKNKYEVYKKKLNGKEGEIKREMRQAYINDNECLYTIDSLKKCHYKLRNVSEKVEENEKLSKDDIEGYDRAIAVYNRIFNRI